LPKVAMVFGQMMKPPGARFASGALGPNDGGEIFRDAEGKDVFCFLSTIFSVSLKPVRKFPLCLGRIPSAVGYQPTLASEMGAMQERITSTDKVQ